MHLHFIAVIIVVVVVIINLSNGYDRPRDRLETLKIYATYVYDVLFGLTRASLHGARGTCLASW